MEILLLAMKEENVIKIMGISIEEILIEIRVNLLETFFSVR